MRKAEDYFMGGWCLVMPITNFVVFPSVPGTIPAYFFALGSLGFIAVRLLSGTIEPRVLGYLKIFGVSLILWAVLLTGSQLGHVLNDRHSFGDIPIIAPEDQSILFRSQIITQSMYLFASILIALYFRFFFQPHMMRYVYNGAYLMALYGVYEWLYYLIFKQPGDFLGNRVYGLGQGVPHTGSWSQEIDFAGLHLLRIKSTYGEPSFFSAAVVPYFFLALDNRQRLLTGLLFFTAFFSTSTSCYLSLAGCFLVRSFWVGKRIGSNVGIALLFAVGLFAMDHLFPDTFNQLFGDKFSGDTDSGHVHQKSFDALMDLLGTFSPFNWIFGIGIGYVYTSVTLAVFFNTGLIGLGVFLYMFLKPIFALSGRIAESLCFKSAVLGIFVAYTLNVSEFYLPTTWMFLGLAYWKLAHQHETSDSGLGNPFSPPALQAGQPAAG